MSVFNLDNQNENLDNKIVAGLERLSHVFRILLWEKAKEFSLSPIQIQLMIFIQHHSQEKSTVTYLAQEFNLTKPTISDSIKTLEQKQLIRKITDNRDTRSFTIKLTDKGQKVVSETEDFASPLTHIISNSNPADKLVLWDSIANLITQLNKVKVITIQRTCINCKHYSTTNKTPFCNLLNKKLEIQDIRIDCNEFETS